MKFRSPSSQNEHYASNLRGYPFCVAFSASAIINIDKNGDREKMPPREKFAWCVSSRCRQTPAYNRVVFRFGWCMSRRFIK